MSITIRLDAIAIRLEAIIATRLEAIAIGLFATTIPLLLGTKDATSAATSQLDFLAWIAVAF